MSRTVSVVFAVALGLVAIGTAAAESKRTVIGILPVFDNSAEAMTENLPPNLAYMIYRELLSNPAYEPVLLSPGGLYDPDAIDWITDYAAKAKVDVVLIASILPSVKVNQHRRCIVLEIRLLNVANGKLSPKARNDTVEVGTSELFSYGATTYVASTFDGWSKGPKEFEKEPLGKAARQLVEWTRDYIPPALWGLEVLPTGAGARPQPAKCDIDFRIRYVTKRSASKSYSLIVDNLDETSMINDGIAHFSIASGPLALRVQVKDAPYGMQIQKLYQTSTILDCSSPLHTLVMEMGNAGDSLLRWQ
jgi:hypothetical protein